MNSPEDPSGFVICTEAQKVAWDFGSTAASSAPAGCATRRPRRTAGFGSPAFYLTALAGIDRSPGCRRGARTLANCALARTRLATFTLDTLTALHAALDRVNTLGVSLPRRPARSLSRADQPSAADDRGRTAPCCAPPTSCPDPIATTRNGLLLSALWNAAGLVSFEDDGTVLASPVPSPATRAALGIEGARPPPDLRDVRRTNLSAHRARHGF
jgi:hypothetical protein